MKRSQVIRLIGFLLVVCLLILALCDVFKYKTSQNSTRIYKYEKLQANTVDVSFIGTSAVSRAVNGAQAYKEEGLTLYPVATNAAPSWAMKTLIKESFVNQNPTLIAIDLRPFIVDAKAKRDEIRARYLIDCLPFFSARRLSLINDTQKVMKELNDEKSRFDLSYFFSFIKYHSEWGEKDFSLYNSREKLSSSMGLFLSKRVSIRKVEFSGPKAAKESVPLDPINERYLYEVFDYVRKNNINVVFVDIPHYYDEETAGRYETVYKILEKEGFSYLNFNDEKLMEECGFDRSTDWYDDSHLNYYGAEKFTRWFAEYVVKNYDVPDRRKSEGFDDTDWVNAGQYISEFISELELAEKEQGEPSQTGSSDSSS